MLLPYLWGGVWCRSEGRFAAVRLIFKGRRHRHSIHVRRPLLPRNQLQRVPRPVLKTIRRRRDNLNTRKDTNIRHRNSAIIRLQARIEVDATSSILFLPITLLPAFFRLSLIGRERRPRTTRHRISKDNVRYARQFRTKEVTILSNSNQPMRGKITRCPTVRRQGRRFLCKCNCWPALERYSSPSTPAQ